MSIELVLNLCWLGVAVAALGHWCVQLKNPDQKTLDRGRAFIALVCALVLLFPVISLTDDIYITQMLANPHQTDLLNLIEVAKSKLMLLVVAIVSSLMLLLAARAIWRTSSLQEQTASSVIWVRKLTNRPPPAQQLAIFSI